MDSVLLGIPRLPSRASEWLSLTEKDEQFSNMSSFTLPSNSDGLCKMNRGGVSDTAKCPFDTDIYNGLAEICVQPNYHDLDLKNNLIYLCYSLRPVPS